MGRPRVRVLVRVRGRVQGVGFRYSCSRAAETHGVDGWVRNRPDGAVEAAFEGAPDAVDAMVQWMRSGPRFAQITSVDVSDEPAVGESGFRIRDQVTG